MIDLKRHGLTLLPAGGVTTASPKGLYVSFGLGPQAGFVQIVAVAKRLVLPKVLKKAADAGFGEMIACNEIPVFDSKGEKATAHFRFWSIVFHAKAKKAA